MGFRSALLFAACLSVVALLAFALKTTKPGPTSRPLAAVSVRPAVELALAAGSAHKLGPVSIVAEAESRFSWDESQRRLRLDSGAIVVDLPPGSLPGFHVLCRDFSVEVTGTRFRVDPSSVRVERGEVRVRSTASQQLLAASLSAGSVWSAVGAISSTAAVEATRPKLAAGSPSDPPAHAPPKASAGEASERVSQAPLLRSIRTKIANGEVADARRLLRSLKPGSLTVDEQLEADSLRAEADLVDGKSRAAVEGYAAAAESSAAKAEVAEFAAARLSAQRGDPAHARQLLERYLERHPRGMFRREARARLRQLGAPPP